MADARFLDPDTDEVLEIRGPEGLAWTIERAPCGNPLAVTAPDGAVTRYAYADPQLPDRPTAHTDCSGRTRRYRYDAEGRLLTSQKTENKVHQAVGISWNRRKFRLVLYGNLPYALHQEDKIMPAAISTARLEARISTDLHSMLKRAAELQGRTMTDFVVAAVQDAAQRAIEQAEVIRLSLADQECFAQALLSPPQPPPALERAFARRRKLLRAE